MRCNQAVRRSKWKTKLKECISRLSVTIIAFRSLGIEGLSWNTVALFWKLISDVDQLEVASAVVLNAETMFKRANVKYSFQETKIYALHVTIVNPGHERTVVEIWDGRGLFRCHQEASFTTFEGFSYSWIASLRATKYVKWEAAPQVQTWSLTITFEEFGS